MIPTILLTGYSALETLIGKFRPLGAGSLPELLVILAVKAVTLIVKPKQTISIQGGSSMTNDVGQTVTLPPNSNALAQQLSKFTLALFAAKKAGKTGMALYEAIGEEAISDFSGALPEVTGAESEVTAEPIGVAEAFAIAGFQVARSLTGK